MDKKGLLIFLHEFVYKIQSTGFIILTIIVPVIALIGIGIFNLAKMAFEEPEGVVTTIGYIDEVGDFDDHTDMGITKFVPLADYFEDQGVPKLTQHAACNLDYSAARELGADLMRTQTIADGAAYCDFGWNFKAYPERS
jgi:hypothetical protein